MLLLTFSMEEPDKLSVDLARLVWPSVRLEVKPTLLLSITVWTPGSVIAAVTETVSP